jgi:pimeloyl-ACP methyl ester carboxylesterase
MQRSPARPHGRTRRREKTVTLHGGLRLPYAEQGDPGGVPLLLLHGYSDSWQSYDLMLEQLPEAVHAYAVTQRGHGDADRPAAGYGLEEHAADVAAFLDAMGHEAAVIVGHSGGSYTAQRFALDHPDRTLGLVLIGAFDSFATEEFRELLAVVDELTDPVDPAFVREFQESTIAEPVPPAFLDRIVAESRKLPARVWQTWLREMIDAEPPSAAGTIDAPTLILWGDRDDYCPRASQDALLAAIPGARLVAYEGAGHCPHWERPAEAAQEIAAFAFRSIL